MTRRRRSVARLLSAAGAAVVVALMTAAPAVAHAVFVGSEPEAQEVLREPPSEVVLHFSDVVQDDISDVRVTAPDGEQFTDAVNENTVIRVGLDTSAEGTYVVEWRTTSSLDGHTIANDFEFTVQATPEMEEPRDRPDRKPGREAEQESGETPADGDSAGDEGQSSSIDEDAPGSADDDVGGGDEDRDLKDSASPGRGRGAAALALFTGIGRTLEYLGWFAVLGWSTLGAIARRLGLDWAPRRPAAWVTLAFVGALATVGFELAQIGGGDPFQGGQAFLLTRGGSMRLARLALAALAVATMVVAARGHRHDPDARPARPVVALSAVAGLTAIAASGHAASNIGGVVVGAGHLITAGVWAGTLVAMAVHRPPGGWRSEIGGRLLRAFAPIALTAFIATVLLGSLRGVQELERVSDLWTSAYGQVLSVKILLVTAMVPLSLSAWRRTRPHLRIEASLVVAVTVLAAVLVGSTPPSRTSEVTTPDLEASSEPRPDPVGPQPVAAGLPTEQDLTLARGVGTTVVGLTVSPQEPGVNEVFVTLVPADGFEAADDLDVSLAVSGDDALPLERCGDACHRTTVSLDGGEDLRVDVVDGGERDSATFTLPDLPAADASPILDRVDERMQQLSTLRYDEVFGPHEPPTRSTWEIVAPDRLAGVITRGDDYREQVRIGDRRWRREGRDGTWQGGESTGLTVKANRFLWDDQERVATRVVGEREIDGVMTREISFFTLQRDLPIWYRLWVDDDDLVRRAEMRTQAHFMDHRYYDFGAAIEIRPPT